MLQDTFFLIKPDTRSKEVVVALLRECEKNNIEYIKTQQMYLSEKQIIKLWEKSCCSDYVLRKILVKYYLNRSVQIIFVKGDDVYAKAHRIKHYIRDTYAMDWYKNCVHSPDNFEEFQRNISVLDSSNKEELTDDYLNVYDLMTRSYVDYLEMNKNGLNTAVDFYFKVDKNWYGEREKQLKHKYKYLLEICEFELDKSVTHVMAQIHDCMKNTSVKDELIFAEGLFMFGRIAVEGGNDANELEELRKAIAMYQKAIITA